VRPKPFGRSAGGDPAVADPDGKLRAADEKFRPDVPYGNEGWQTGGPKCGDDPGGDISTGNTMPFSHAWTCSGGILRMSSRNSRREIAPRGRRLAWSCMTVDAGYAAGCPEIDATHPPRAGELVSPVKARDRSAPKLAASMDHYLSPVLALALALPRQP
jgi:hypothetical protein